MKVPSLAIQKLGPMLKFLKSRSNFKVKRSKIWYPQKGLVKRNKHVIYQSPSTYHSKVIAKDKVSDRMTEWQND